jgi:hypothetical protein
MHHANKENIVMVKWLPNTPSTIPQPSSHYVGVGVAVVDEQNRILVVQEKFGPASRRVLLFSHASSSPFSFQTHHLITIHR